MKKNLLNLLPILVFIFYLQGCNVTQSVSSENQILTNPTSTPIVSANANSNENSNLSVNSGNEEDIGEIKNCTPEKVYRGENIRVSMKTPHGVYAAIRRVGDDKWFFLYGGKENEPVWNDNSFTKLEEITINTETAFNSTNVDVGEKPEKIFTKTGKYRIMVSREDFGQDDPPWTGMCEVSYIAEKRPK